MDSKKSIEALQFFVTHLTEGALVHKMQGQIIKSQGFDKLGEKYIGHFVFVLLFLYYYLYPLFHFHFSHS